MDLDFWWVCRKIYKHNGSKIYCVSLICHSLAKNPFSIQYLLWMPLLWDPLITFKHPFSRLVSYKECCVWFLLILKIGVGIWHFLHIVFEREAFWVLWQIPLRKFYKYLKSKNKFHTIGRFCEQKSSVLIRLGNCTGSRILKFRER